MSREMVVLIEGLTSASKEFNVLRNLAAAPTAYSTTAADLTAKLHAMLEASLCWLYQGGSWLIYAPWQVLFNISSWHLKARSAGCGIPFHLSRSRLALCDSSRECPQHRLYAGICVTIEILARTDSDLS
ncbi:hypothetical protein DOTSEDRAFT_44424 [Dothistroma septosporum NZE10]|uniref:Uncharacterized protein n=1 Tax=Dothistroma septosporum (strain NZE10 / CBS 128990) TaxID=675120 RepID=N1PP60_DOTSN|nr:hypothetical protein DOTSEDRAFT_44424 [Dothistroma septosporum NZE10]